MFSVQKASGVSLGPPHASSRPNASQTVNYQRGHDGDTKPPSVAESPPAETRGAESSPARSRPGPSENVDSFVSPEESGVEQSPELRGHQEVDGAVSSTAAANATGIPPQATGATTGANAADPSQSEESLDESDYVFVFTNPTSGGNKAAAFTNTAVSRLTFTEPCHVTMFIYDIREGPSGSKPGFLLLKAISDRVAASATSGAHTIRILAAGGDGTVMWCVDEMKKTGVNSDVCAVGVVPYGTGNDFAKAFGWRPFNAAKPFDASLHTLRKLLEHCVHASVVYHDLWTVNVNLRPGGTFTKINSTTRQKEVVEQAGSPVESLSFTMSNYFSMGVESRIGRGFDRHRTKSQTLNKMRYGIEGFKKAFFTHTKSINQILTSLTEHPGTPEERLIFTTVESEAAAKAAPLLKKTATLVALNIPSFGGGNDIWAPSKKYAVSISEKEAQSQAKELMKVPQLMGDGKLEFMTFRNIPSMGMEFMLHGRGSRLYSGTGPWEINFRTLDDTTRVYFQTDGEFFQLTKPSSVRVAHDRRVRVLSLRTGNKQVVDAGH